MRPNPKRSDRKIRELQANIQAAISGLTKIVHCPYCRAELDFTPPSALDTDWQLPTCCETFALGTIAVLKRIEQREMKDLADRIRDKAGGLAVFN